jgi:hypothetical protein
MFRHRPLTTTRIVIASILGLLGAQTFESLSQPFTPPSRPRYHSSKRRHQNAAGKYLKNYGGRYSHVLTEYCTEQNLRRMRQGKRK